MHFKNYKKGNKYYFYRYSLRSILKLNISTAMKRYFLLLILLIVSKIAAQSGYTSFEVLPNLYVNIEGKFDSNYKPKWQFINTSSILNFKFQDNVVQRSLIGDYAKKEVVLQAYDGRPMVGFSTFINCFCFAEIDIPNKVVLSETPRMFSLRNFEKLVNGMPSGQPCVGLSTHTQGGWDGDITLAANNNGRISMQLVLRNKNRNGQYAYIYTGNAVMPNLAPVQIPVSTVVPIKNVDTKERNNVVVAPASDSLEYNQDDVVVVPVLDSLEYQDTQKKEDTIAQSPTEDKMIDDGESFYDWFARQGEKLNNAFAPFFILTGLITFNFLLKDRKKNKNK